MEYTKKCNVCGKVFCYTDEDIRENASNSLMAGLNALGGLASLGGGTIFHTQHFTQQGDRYSDKVVTPATLPFAQKRRLPHLKEKRLPPPSPSTAVLRPKLC